MINVCDNNRAKNTRPVKLKVLVLDEEIGIGYNFPPIRRPSMKEEPTGQTQGTHKSPSLGRIYRYPKVKPYTFTRETMAFVEKQSQLLASLVRILCLPEGSPSLQQLDLQTAEGHFIPETEEVEREGEKDVELCPPSSFTQSHHPARAGVKVPFTPPKLQRSQSESDSILPTPNNQWRKVFSNLVKCFEKGSPLLEYLNRRLKPFEGLIPWDRLVQEASTTQSDAANLFKQDPTINLRSLTILPSHSEELGHACGIVVRKLLKRGMIETALRFMKTEPVINNKQEVKFAVDLALCSAFNKLVTRDESNGESLLINCSPLVLIYQLSDAELASRLVLSSLQVWQVEMCVDLVTLCYYHLSKTSSASSSFLPLVRHHLDRLQTYFKIIETIDSPLSSESDRSSPWNHWADLAKDTSEKPEYVLSILLESKSFQLAWDWARVHGLSENITKVLNSLYSSSCLTVYCLLLAN